MAERRQRVKSIYFPGDPDGKGIVAVAFSVDDSEQMSVFEAIEDLGSTEIRDLIGISTWSALHRMRGEAKVSSFLRTRLTEAKERVSDRLARSGPQIRSAPARTEDPLERAATYMDWVAEYRRKRKVRSEPCVIDPFAGTGNFLVAAAQRGWESVYCENDPVAGRHLELKLAILERAREARVSFAEELNELAEGLGSRLDREAKTGVASGELPRRAARVPRLPAGTLRRAIAARRIASSLKSRRSLASECLEIASAWAAASCAITRGSRDEDAFDERVRQTLVDFARLASEAIELHAAPQFVCADARDLGGRHPLGVNALVTTLPPFEAVTQVSPARRMESWMLGLLDQRGEAKGLDDSRPRDLAAGAVERFLFSLELPDDSIYFRKLRDVLGEYFREIGRRIEKAKGKRSEPTLRRAGYAAVRYFAMIASVLEGLMNVWDRSEGGIAVIEVSNTSVIDMPIDTPQIVATYLESLRATQRRRETVQRSRSRSGGERVKEVLEYALPAKQGGVP